MSTHAALLLSHFCIQHRRPATGPIRRISCLSLLQLSFVPLEARLHTFLDSPVLRSALLTRFYPGLSPLSNSLLLQLNG